MIDLSNEKNQQILLYVILGIALCGTILFLMMGIQHKRENIQKITIQSAQLKSLQQQLLILDNLKRRQHPAVKISKASQIYDLLTESADYSHLSLKSFTTIKKTNDLEAVLIGSYPNLITFFKYLWEKQFSLVKAVHVKNYSQDSAFSIEVTMTITSPMAKGGK